MIYTEGVNVLLSSKSYEEKHPIGVKESPDGISCYAPSSEPIFWK